MIVVDANIIIYWAMDAPESDLVERLREHDPDWRTVPLWRQEFTSAMLTLMRARQVDVRQAHRAMERADVWASPREVAVSQIVVLHVALRDGISAYDAQYVALAESLSTRCATADKPLARKCPQSTLLLADFAT
jgi:predicted nucleic acid-binding protein